MMNRARGMKQEKAEDEDTGTEVGIFRKYVRRNARVSSIFQKIKATTVLTHCLDLPTVCVDA